MLNKNVYLICVLTLLSKVTNAGVVDLHYNRSSHNLKIINGTEALGHSVPSIAYLEIVLPRGKFAICGGSLLTPNYALTAAHCVERQNYVKLKFGIHSVVEHESTMVLRYADNIIIHENYKDLKNDIAVIRLSRPVKETQYIKYAKLVSQNEVDPIYFGKKVTVYGWGYLNDNFDEPDNLMKVSARVISLEECQEIYGPKITYTQLCTSAKGEKHKGICNGDSGGPLLLKDGTQIGIASYRRDVTCENSYPSVYTKVYHYLDWIKEHTDLI